MSVKTITPPAAEPVSVQEAKLHLRLIADVADTTPHPEDGLIASLIVAARQGAEHITGRALMPQTLELALDRFCDGIKLPRPPFASIESIKYIDPEGVTQTIATGAWRVDDYSEPALVLPPYGEAWPTTRAQENAVLIRYVAGYANAAEVPAQIKSWMLLRIGMLYENRESVTAGVTLAELPQIDRLLDAERIWSL